MAIQIFILSKLIEENTYPYKLKKQLSDPIPLDQLAGLTESKLYYHFESLMKQGLIEPVEVIREEHRPDKQVFAITSKGREALPGKIYTLFEKADAISDMFVGLANMKYVEREKVVDILEKKMKNIKERLEQIMILENKLQIDKEKEKFLEFITDYISAKANQKTYWLEQLIKRIEIGEI
ncbi:PadR family transcriptional regulator [Niallia sp.]|uniref:PadR family transcriptional regulator n=1 Tax=Niallia sp. TaxID=2837523 RepID=UPI0028A0886E|nr:PadR family transcriptional regulator [Niallia sp.]